MALKSLGKITVASAGTPVVASADDIYCSWFKVYALAANTGNIIPGDSTLDSATLAGAFHDGLSAGQPLEIAPGSPGANPINLAQVKIDATVNGESAIIYYVQT